MLFCLKGGGATENLVSDSLAPKLADLSHGGRLLLPGLAGPAAQWLQGSRPPPPHRFPNGIIPRAVKLLPFVRLSRCILYR